MSADRPPALCGAACRRTGAAWPNTAQPARIAALKSFATLIFPAPRGTSLRVPTGMPAPPPLRRLSVIASQCSAVTTAAGHGAAREEEDEEDLVLEPEGPMAA
eukprot:SAG22_NODE_17367_length_306_cov_0.748792_1_plen_102_part_11